MPILATRLLASPLLAGLLAGCAVASRAPVEERSTTASAASETYTVRKNDTLYSIAWRHNLEYRALADANRIEPPYTVYPGQRIRLLGAPSSTPPGAAERMATARPTAAAAEPARTVRTDAPKLRPSRAEQAEQDSTKPRVANAPAPKPPAAVPKPGAARKPAPAKPAAVPKPAPAKPAAAQKPAPARPRTPASPAAGAWLRPVDAKPVRGFGGGSNGLDYALPPQSQVRAATAGVVVYAGPGLGGFRHLVIVKASERHLVAYGVNVAPKLKEGDTVARGITVARLGNGDAASRRFHFEVRDRGKPVDPVKLIGGG